MLCFVVYRVSLLAACLCLLAQAAQAQSTPRRPNVVIVYADDLGYGDVSSYGSKTIATPHIDRLAREGLRFTDAHAAAATCTPSRYSLMTGEYAFRQKGTGVLPGNAGLIIRPGRATLPAIFQRAGYRTGVVGKWHLGLGPNGGPDWNGTIAPGPREVGFDESFIMAATGDRVPTVYVENGRVVGLDPADPIVVRYDAPVGDWPTGARNPEKLRVHPSHGHDQTIVNGISRIGYMTGGRAALWRDEDMADVFAGQAVRFIERHAREPFFLVFATHDPHVPRTPHPRFVGASGMGPRGDAIVQADWAVGQVLGALDRLKLTGDTLVIFTSDNGPVVDDGYQDRAVELLGSHRPAGDLRGGKYSLFEGGTRVPFIVRWPAAVAPGVSPALLSQVDLLSSFAGWLGQPAPPEARDSVDVMRALLGTSRTARETLVEQAGGFALRQGTWKYIEPNPGPEMSRQTNTELGNFREPQLYDLASDIGERRNLAATDPMRLNAMRAMLDGIRAGAPPGEDGYDLWLRYTRIDDDGLRDTYLRATTSVVARAESPTERVVVAELARGLKGLLDREPPRGESVAADGALVVGTPSRQPAIRALGWEPRLAALGPDGYVIQSTRIGGRAATVIASQTDVGTLYGAFHFLRLLQTGRSVDALAIEERPRLARRLLNHWDNLDGTIERGYAGRSLWNWNELPARVDPRVEDYARANASLGINGTVVNSVNANPRSLTADYLRKAAALADTFRPYGIRLYLAANFAAPKTLGGLPTTDPLDPAVARWWREKADEIYALIPDFGGFVVKANSEGQPGPQDYKRTHADGANVLADAVARHGGIVMWRAFVYNADVDPDRVKRAYMEFVPIDSQFRDNVFVQVKNGPLDFQPREPFHPLFGALKTPVLTELQITQEYFGHSTHLVYLAPMWHEFFSADTFARGPGSPVAKVVDGSLTGERRTGIAGVANTGSDRNWTGHHLAQANWFAYGRLAWNPDADPAAIAEDWIRATWSRDPAVVETIRSLLLESYETYVDYTMPLGLHHLIGGDHYAPMPENPDPRRADWSAVYYHRADAGGIGFDRTPAGSNYVGQYRSPLEERWASPSTTPENLLLWFHHLPWSYRLSNGRSLWQGLVDHYTRGAEKARGFVTRWQTLAGKVDDARHQAVLAKLEQQASDAALWRDKCLKYFQQFSKRPIEP